MFQLSSNKSLVWKLNKTFYGLKQAPRQWFTRLQTTLNELGFLTSTFDTSLFTYKKETEVIYFLVYVDDIIITSSSPSLIQSVTEKLHATFSLKQLGQLDYFLDLEIKYLHDLLHKTHMVEAHAISSPIVSNIKLSKHGADVFSDPTLYMSIVGAMQYATLARPEISFVVNKVFQFMANPLNSHSVVVKCILWYLKGTFFHGLHFQPALLHSPVSLTTFCDSDWASDI